MADNDNAPNLPEGSTGYIPAATPVPTPAPTPAPEEE